jgi:hypothetical protein
MRPSLRQKKVLGPLADHVRQEDFFSPSLRPQEFDFVYERAFLCALPRRMWSDWTKRVAELIAPGGRLGGFFYFDESERGPPFGLKTGELEGSLSPRFRLIETAAPQDSIKVFEVKELWQVWERLPFSYLPTTESESSGDPVLLEPSQHAPPTILRRVLSVRMAIVGIKSVRRIGIHH